MKLNIGEILTLDEAIEHCKEVINDNSDCPKCMREHGMLLVWLEELKELRKFKNTVVRAL